MRRNRNPPGALSDRGQALIVSTFFFALAGATLLAWAYSLGWLERTAVGAVLGAFVAFLGATTFKYLFERVRDEDLIEAEKVSLAAALFAEICAILVRGNEHYRWLIKCYFVGAPAGDEAERKVKLPEVYAIFDTDVFEAVRDRIGIFDPELTALLVTTYHSLATSKRRADRYVKQTKAAVYQSLGAAIVETGRTLDAGTKAALMLKRLAGIKAAVPEYRPLHATTLGNLVIVQHPDSQNATMSSLTPANAMTFEIDPSAARGL